ncbi:DNA-binding protein BIN4 [Diospyros lotus]|uniref:DNA-binding protein BIN4 n=1 Tax=Diospyros lotus TaxID=55363 RepID=UPI0022502C91|nr:DNA-binding protein BIN4 [Diospyros lotus]
MSSSREESPDWFRAFQAPTQSVLMVSLDSDSSPSNSPLREDTELSSKETSQFPVKDEDQDMLLSGHDKESSPSRSSEDKSSIKQSKVEHTPVKKKKKTDYCRKRDNGSDGKSAKPVKSEKEIEPDAPENLVLALSSDSESPYKPAREASKGKSPKKRLKTEDPLPEKKGKVNSNNDHKKGDDGDEEVADEGTAGKHIEPRFSSSRLPLLLSEKVSLSKALVECEGESIDLSGDVGAVGRVVISANPPGNQEMLLDLKGTIYKTTIVPSRTFCVVSFGQSEAKIEAIMNDFIQLKPQSNVYEAETMVEGTLDGFSFDSEDDADKVPGAITNQTDQTEGQQANGKPKTKASKTSGVANKRGKAAGAKAPKKVKKKTQAPKKGRTKK